VLILSRKPKNIARNSKSKKGNVKRYSWHFWFIFTLTIFALLIGYSGENPLIGSLILGALIYLSPWFLCAVRGWMPRELMLKFYKKHKH
jgi:hypothetical protein